MNENLTVAQLEKTLDVSRPDIVRYATCFNIDLRSFCLKPQDYFASYLELYDDSIEFFREHVDRIMTFNADFFSWKTIKEICNQLEFSLEEFINFYNDNKASIESFHSNTPPNFETNKTDDGKIKLTLESKVKNISTQYLIHLYHGFPPKVSRLQHSSDIEVEKSEFEEIIGYEDFKLSVIDLLNPIVDSKALDLWKLRRPGGIMLFGPPGCGKTFWAMQIAKYVGFEFVEIPRSLFASSYVDGAAKNLKSLLDKTEPRTVLFFDEFDSVAETRNTESSGSRENIKVVNTLLQEIPKLISKDVLIIAATNYLYRIDAAVIRPGRFDLKIPIFPPNPIERSQIVFQKLTNGLNNNSPLSQIIKLNKITSNDFFMAASNKMKLYSSSLLEDFVDTLKRKIKYLFDTGIVIEDIVISEELIDEVIARTNTKIISQDLEFLANFYLEVDAFVGAQLYSARMSVLKEELASKYKGEKDPPKPIGFRMPKTD